MVFDVLNSIFIHSENLPGVHIATSDYDAITIKHDISFYIENSIAQLHEHLHKNTIATVYTQ